MKSVCTSVAVLAFGLTAASTTTVNAAANLAVTKISIPAMVDVNVTYLYRINVTNTGPSAAPSVQIVDTLPVGVSYIGSSGASCTLPPATVVTCTIGSISSPGSFGPIDITVRANAAGVLTNQVTVSDGIEVDPDLTDNTATANTTVQVPPTAVRHFTVRSKGGSTAPTGENLLEWVNPGGSAVNVSISRTEAATGAPCQYETTAGGATQIHTRSIVLTRNQYEFFTDAGLTNGKTYCYTIFVDMASPRFSSGRPFNAVTGLVRWANNLGTWSMAPVGNGRGVVHMVANDNVLYSLVKGTSGGSWPGPLPPSMPAFPLQWTPFGFMSAPAQGRPGTYPLPVGPDANSVVFLSSQDGRVYAIDAEEGGATLFHPWTSLVLGPTVIAHISAMFSAFGGATDVIVVGSRETPMPSTFYALRLSDGTFGAPPGWKQDGGPPVYPKGKIGPILGQAAVDYNTSPPRVYFASRAFGLLPDDNTLWCLNLLTGAVIWAKPYGDIDAGVTLRGDRLYIATNNPPTVQAVDKNTGNVAWTPAFIITPGEGPAKGFVYARDGSIAGRTELYFATKSRIWSLTDDGGPSYTENWLPGGVAMNSPSTPIALPGDTFVYVGSGDGSLHRRTVGSGGFFGSFPLGDATPSLVAGVGSPTFDLRNRFIYVGSEAGIVYAIEKP